MVIIAKSAGNAMNIIPSIFDEHQIKRTVIGGQQDTSEKKINLSLILLNSNGSHLNLNIFENLVKCKFDSIISIEHDSDNYSLDDITKKFPSVKFIIPLEPTTDGEMINIAMSEVKTEYVLVIRDTLHIPASFISQNLVDKLLVEKKYCIVPWLMDKTYQGLPVHYIPGAEKSHFVIESSVKILDGIKTVYPFDYIAFYNKNKFIQLGGFDYTIRSPYWQNLDLALRSWLWGEETKITTLLQLSYKDEVPVEDSTFNQDYLRYYLKNEVPKFKNEKAYISRRFFNKFRKRSSCGYLEAKKQYKNAKKWVEKNQYKFKQDLQSFVQNWDLPNE